VSGAFGLQRNSSAGRAKHIAVNEAAFAAYLRALYPRDTAPNVAADLGVSTRTVENWLAGTTTPRLAHFLRMVGAYGPSVIAAAYPAAPRWLDDAVRAERIRATEAEIKRLEAQLAEER
jgi:hypothetical protein